MVSKKGLRIGEGGNWTSERFNDIRNMVNTRYAKSSLISGSAYGRMMSFLNGKSSSRGGIFNPNVAQDADPSLFSGAERWPYG